MKAAGLLAIITVSFYWKLTFSHEFTFLDAPDLAYQVLPWYQFQAKAWHSGTFPLWDPYQWCGQPLIGQLQPGVTFPLNWPLFLAPLKDGRLNLDWFHWHFVLMHWLAALFMYAYCRELERSRAASLIAGCGFSFGGYVGTTVWPQMMNGAIWTPLIFLFCHRSIRAGQGRAAAANAAGCGASIGLALLAGHHQVPAFVALALSAVFLYERRIRLLAVTAVFAALVGAFALVPAWEYGLRAYRWVNLPSPLRMNETIPYLAQHGLGLIPLSLLGLVMPVDTTTANPFIGLVAVSLGLFGLAKCWETRPVRLHSCLALGGLAYALGAYSIFQGVLYAVVPYLDKARSPGQAVLLFHFGLLVVAAYGVDALSTASVWSKRLVRGLVVAAALVWVAQLLLQLRGIEPSGRSQSMMLAALAAFLLAISIRVRSPVGILLVLLAELSAGTSYLIHRRTDPQNPTLLDRFAQHRGVVQFLRSQAGPFRFHADDQEIPENLGDWDGLEQSAGYLASVSADLYDFIGLDWNRMPLLLNQVYFIGKERSRPEQVEVFSEPGGLKVFRNPDASPRAWLATRVRGVADRTAAIRLMQSPDYDPRREAFVFGQAPALEACNGAGSVTVARQGIHRVEARVNARCQALAVFSDPMFPGWKARLDGAPVALYAAYGALRGVVVPSGEHRIEFLYRPFSVYVGATLSLAGLAGWLLLSACARSSKGTR